MALPRYPGTTPEKKVVPKKKTTYTFGQPKKTTTLDLGGPAPVYPGTKSKAPPSTGIALKAILTKYPAWSNYKSIIINSASQWGVDPADLLSLLIFENAGALNYGGPGGPKPNAAGALGLAQIVDTVVDKSLNPSRYQEFVNQYGNAAGTSATNQTFAINYAAWRLSGGIKHYPSLNDWYRGTNGFDFKGEPAPRGFNPGFPGNAVGAGPSAIYTNAGVASYQPKYAQTPEAKAQKSRSYKAPAQALANPYVTGLGSNGKLTTSTNPEAASGALTYDGTPLTQSQFLQVRRALEPYFVSYTGGRPSDAQVVSYIKNGWSPYTLTDVLSKGTAFKSSPIYKKMSLAFKGAGRDLVPTGRSLDPELLRQAIVNDWDVGAFQEKLRELPSYEHSNEFQNNFDVLSSSYRQIMGAPQGDAADAIKQVTKNGWTQSKFEAWLRGTPAYAYSPEYQAKTVNFLDQMGLLIGSRPVAMTTSKKPEASKLGKAEIEAPLNLTESLPTVAKQKAPLSIPASFKTPR